MEFHGRQEVVAIALAFLLAVEAAGADEFTKGENNGCSTVKMAWGLHGLGTVSMVPSSPLPGL